MVSTDMSVSVISTIHQQGHAQRNGAFMAHLYSYIPNYHGIDTVITSIQVAKQWQTAVGSCLRVLYTWEMVFIHQ